jgi:hypothetical protein
MSYSLSTYSAFHLAGTFLIPCNRTRSESEAIGRRATECIAYLIDQDPKTGRVSLNLGLPLSKKSPWLRITRISVKSHRFDRKVILNRNDQSESSGLQLGVKIGVIIGGELRPLRLAILKCKIIKVWNKWIYRKKRYKRSRISPRTSTVFPRPFLAH